MNGGRFIKGLTTGAIIGATAGIMMVPRMSRRTRKVIKRNGQMVMNRAGDMFENIKDMMM